MKYGMVQKNIFRFGSLVLAVHFLIFAMSPVVRSVEDPAHRFAAETSSVSAAAELFLLRIFLGSQQDGRSGDAQTGDIVIVRKARGILTTTDLKSHIGASDACFALLGLDFMKDPFFKARDFEDKKINKSEDVFPPAHSGLSPPSA